MTISVSFSDEIEKSKEYDLAITKISYVITANDKDVKKGDLEFAKDKALSLSVSKEISELMYAATAYNAEGDVIGEGNGNIKIAGDADAYSIPVFEKEGDGTLTVTITKDKKGDFPVVIVGEKEYTVKASETSETVGFVSIPLSKGVYSVSCGEEKEEVRIVAGKTKSLNFSFTTEYIPVSFVDNIKKSEEFDLEIAKIDYSFPELESEYSAEGVEYKEDLVVSVPKVMGEVKYNIVAYNSDGFAVGEGKGSLLIEKGTEKLSITIEEKEGDGIITFNLTKDYSNTFPEIKVGDKVVEIEISEDNTAGTGSITLKNGVYDIYVGGTVKESIRIIQGVEKTISYDYTRRWVHFRFSVDVNQDDSKGLNLGLDHYHFVVTDSKGYVIDDTLKGTSGGLGLLEDDYEYLFEAVNSDGIAFAEAKGKLLLSEYVEPYYVVMTEKEGNGKLLVNCKKISSDDFPVLKVADKEYTFEESSKNEGTVTITLPNGTYTVVCGGEERIIRIAVDQTNTIDFDFSYTPIPTEVINNIPKYDGYDMNVSKVSYYFERNGVVIEEEDASIEELEALIFPKTKKDVWNYVVKAYNLDRVQIGEAGGRYLFGYQTECFKIKLAEKIGAGTIKIVLTVSEKVEFPEVKVEDVSVSKEEFTKEDNVYTYSVNKKSGEYVVSIGDSVKTVRVVNGMEVALSADLSTGINVEIKNNVSASGNYTISPYNNIFWAENENSFEVLLDGVSLDENVSVKWILDGNKLESEATEITFVANTLSVDAHVLYAYIYEDGKLLDIASKLFTVTSSL